MRVVGELGGGSNRVKGDGKVGRHLDDRGVEAGTAHEERGDVTRRFVCGAMLGEEEGCAARRCRIIGPRVRAKQEEAAAVANKSISAVMDPAKMALRVIVEGGERVTVTLPLQLAPSCTRKWR